MRPQGYPARIDEAQTLLRSLCGRRFLKGLSDQAVRKVDVDYEDFLAAL